jgi:hypothetical protein
MGTIWISRRADLTPVYAMIFRRLKVLGADWVCHFPELGLVEFAPANDSDKSSEAYSVSQAALAEVETQKRRTEVERFRTEPRQATCARGGDGSAAACDRARVPAGVRA